MDEKEINNVNDLILDSLNNPNNITDHALSLASALTEANRLKSKYKNGIMRIQDTNGIIYNTEVRIK